MAGRSLIPSGWEIRITLKRWNQINKISEIHGVDVNLYDLQGNLKVSSLPLPYIKGIVSNKMDPLAYYHLYYEKEVQYFQKENIGKLKFVVIMCR